MVSVFACFQTFRVLVFLSFFFFLHFRDVPADTQIEIDGDRETERIYSLFTINMSKLQKLEGTEIVIQKNYADIIQL